MDSNKLSVNKKDLTKILNLNKEIKVMSDIIDTKIEDQSEIIEKYILSCNNSKKKIGELLVELELLSQKDLNKVLSEKTLFGELLIQKGLVSKKTINLILSYQRGVIDFISLNSILQNRE